MAHKVIVPQKKIISLSFLNIGTLIVNIHQCLRIRIILMLFRIRLFNVIPICIRKGLTFNADPDPTFHFDAYLDLDPAPFVLPIRIQILIKVMRT
jgi:hypothetical protein